MYQTFCYATQHTATTATMRIYGEIGWEYSARVFVDELAALEAAGVTEIEVRIHSIGGGVIDGFGMFNAMLNSKATITTVNEGLAASTAGWLLLAGTQVEMADYALLMLHNPSCSDTSQKAQEVCAKMRDSIATILAGRTGNTLEEIQAMMEEETWLTAEECLAKGFITSIQKTETLMKLDPTTQSTNAMLLVVNSALHAPKPLALEVAETAIVEVVEPTPEEAPAPDPETEALVAAEAAIEAEAAAEQAAVEAEPVVAGTVTNAVDLTSRVTELEALVKSYQDKEAAAQAETIRNTATTLVKNAITAGRIEATAEATWVNLAIANPELARTTLDALKPQARTAVNVLAQAQTAAGATNSAGQVSLRELEKKNPVEVARLRKDTPDVYNHLYFNHYGVYPK